MPESFYLLLTKGGLEEAEKSLKRLIGVANLNDNFMKRKSDVERQISESGKNIFVFKNNREALIAKLFVRVSQK